MSKKRLAGALLGCALHVLRSRRRKPHRLVTLEEIDVAGDGPDLATELDESRALCRIATLIQRLAPLDRQLIALHLEGLPADEIAAIAGVSLANTHTHTKLHRIRLLLAAKGNAGEQS